MNTPQDCYASGQVGGNQSGELGQGRRGEGDAGGLRAAGLCSTWEVDSERCINKMPLAFSSDAGYMAACNAPTHVDIPYHCLAVSLGATHVRPWVTQHLIEAQLTPPTHPPYPPVSKAMPVLLRHYWPDPSFSMETPIRSERAKPHPDRRMTMLYPR